MHKDTYRRIYKRLKEIWSNQRDIQEAEWYILIAFFAMVWMWMFIKF